MDSRSLFAEEPQRRASVDDSEAILRNHRRVGGNRLIVGIDAKGRGSQPSARVVETRLGDGLARNASGGSSRPSKGRKLTWFLARLQGRVRSIGVQE